MSSRGSRLVEAMRLRGLHKQHALAFSLGVSESTVTRWKKDGPMSLENAISLCRTLDMSMDWFVLGAGAMEPSRFEGLLSSEEEQVVGFFRRIGERLSEPVRLLLMDLVESISREM